MSAAEHTGAPGTDEDAWYRHYGFDCDPFAEGGVHGLFYPGGARQETVEQLQHLARYSDCVLLVTGVAGAGKSTTRRHFVAQAAPDTRCCVVEAALLDGAAQWLRRALAGFGIRAATPPDLAADIGALAAFCAGRAAKASHSWLVIDDAHDLHEEVVAILDQVLATTGRQLRLVFFAEPRWRETLQAALPPAVALHTLELQPFEQGETYAYIHYRLNTAGLDGEPPFNAQEFERIHRQSGGVPGRINTLAREVLREAAAIVEQPLSTLPLWHFGVIAATLLALLLLYVWGAIDQDEPRAERPPTAQAAVREPAAAGRSAAEPVPTLQIAPDTGGATDEGAAARPPAEDDGADATADASRPAPIELVAARADTDAGGGDDTGAGTDPDIDTPADPAAGVAVTGSAPAPAPAQPPPPQPRPSAEAPSAASHPVQAAPATAGGTTTAASDFVYRAEGRTGGAPSSDEQLLLRLDPAHYVLQIMGSDDGARVRGFAARSGVELRLYRKLHNGREWYSLVTGEYPTRAAAEAAARELPAALRDSRPWVRRLDAIQQEIRTARAL